MMVLGCATPTPEPVIVDKIVQVDKELTKKTIPPLPSAVTDKPVREDFLKDLLNTLSIDPSKPTQ